MQKPTIQWHLVKVNGGWHVGCDILVCTSVYSLGGFKPSLEAVQCVMSYFPDSERGWTEESLLREWKYFFSDTTVIGKKFTSGKGRSKAIVASQEPETTSLFGNGIKS